LASAELRLKEYEKDRRQLMQQINDFSLSNKKQENNLTEREKTLNEKTTAFEIDDLALKRQVSDA